LGTGRFDERLPKTSILNRGRENDVQHRVRQKDRHFAFKKDTNDTRESAAIYVCRDLLEERARLTIYDPKVGLDKIKQELIYLLSSEFGALSEKHRQLIDDNVEVASSAEAAASGAHAIAVLTEWDEFKDVDFDTVYRSMKKPAFLFDGRNLMDREKLSKIGFEVYATGKS
jgi:UDPglucose 6-dehydrogenase